MNIRLITAPYDSGHYKRRLGLGPVVLSDTVNAFLKAHGQVVKRDDVFVDTPFFTEVTTSFAVARKIARQVADAKQNNEFPIVFTGNCNAAALGVISGMNEALSVIWFDCHGDFNTPETTPGGYFDGMSLSILTGKCWTQLALSIPGFKPVPENHIVLAGARDFDPLEETLLKNSDISMLTPSSIRDRSISLSLPPGKVYLHIDLDVLDPDIVNVNEYSTPGGLLPDDIYNMIRVIKENHWIVGIGFTAYDPSQDPDEKVPEIVTKIVDVALRRL